MAGQKCYCGSSFGRNGLSENCTMPCSNDANNSSYMCGSFNAISIYGTGQKGTLFTYFILIKMFLKFKNKANKD